MLSIRQPRVNEDPSGLDVDVVEPAPVFNLSQFENVQVAPRGPIPVDKLLKHNDSVDHALKQPGRRLRCLIVHQYYRALFADEELLERQYLSAIAKSLAGLQAYL